MGDFFFSFFRVERRDEDGEVGAVELAPSAGSASLWVRHHHVPVRPLLQHVRRAELHTQVAPFAPVGERDHTAPSRMLRRFLLVSRRDLSAC